MEWRRKRKGPITMPIASMGDIAFLLIIFFMVCSNFVKESNIQYKSPTSADVAPVDDSGISVVVDKDGKIYLEGKPLADSDALKTKLEALLQGKAADDKKGRSVVFKCDMGLALEDFQPAMEAIVGAGGVLIAVGDPRKEE